MLGFISFLKPETTVKEIDIIGLVRRITGKAIPVGTFVYFKI
jgi:hypothetical protein